MTYPMILERTAAPKRRRLFLIYFLSSSASFRCAALLLLSWRALRTDNGSKVGHETLPINRISRFGIEFL